MLAVNPTTNVGPLTARSRVKAEGSAILKPLVDRPVDRRAADAASRVGFRAFEVHDADSSTSTTTQLAPEQGSARVVEARRRPVAGATPSLSFTQLRECRELVDVVMRVAVLRVEIAVIERDHAKSGAACSDDLAKAGDLATRHDELEAALGRAETIAVGIASGARGGEPTQAAASNQRGRPFGVGRRGFSVRRPAFCVAAACAIVLVSLTPLLTGSIFTPPSRGVSDQALPALLTSTVRASEQPGSPAAVVSESHVRSSVSEGGIVFYPEAKPAQSPPVGAITAAEASSVAFEEAAAVKISSEESAGSLESVDD